MNKISIMAVVLGCCAAAGCSDSMRSGSGTAGTVPPTQRNASGVSGQQYSSGTDNSMPGTQGGFNNDDVNGKSRNPATTTPGTGPMNANPVASGNTPR
jgi:hypothetical protein